MKIKSKKAYFFSLDALIALIIILGVILVIKPTINFTPKEIMLQEDLLRVLSSIKIGEIENDYAKQLINNGTITNLNQSVLEQIGEFYANSDSEATNLAQNILDNLNIDNSIGIYFGGIEIARTSEIPISEATTIWTSRQIISGIQEGESAKGYSSRAFLFSENKVEYFYFGGYIGDGNITVNLKENLINLEIEAVFSDSFDIYLNNQFLKTYAPQSNIPYKIDLSNYSENFSKDSNKIEFKSNKPLYIAGGYIKATYNKSVSNNYHYFPGINGLINIYDGVYIPQELTEMEISLHYKSNEDIFLRIGNTLIYEGNTSGLENTILITDSTLQSLINYEELKETTVPLRLGIINSSYTSNISINADVFSVTDLSGSMNYQCSNTGWFCQMSQNWCQNWCGGTWTSEIPIESAKEANNAFIDYVLNYSGNRVGLVGYAENAPDSDYHQLSNNIVSLKSKVEDWEAEGSTCICCGINKAVEKLVEESDSGKFRSIVIMSDGESNVQCAEQSTGNAKQDAIKASCDAFTNYGIKSYSIGFGTGVDEATLQDIAACGNGNYYYGDISNLVSLYEQVAEDIIRASYYEQTITGEGILTELFPDSYIKITNEKQIPYGLIITAETTEFGNTISQGELIVPNDTEPYEIKVISYSGSKWTDKVFLFNNQSNWESIFNLSKYNLPYIELGDPYVVEIPKEKITQGTNEIKVSTGLNPQNSSGGSPYNKIIYSLIKNISSYSPIVSSAKGCIWHIEFEDGTNTTMSFPSDYSGTTECYYTSSEIPTYNENDAISNAVYLLFTNMDLNSNRRIETKFSENDLTINSVEVTGIPFTWETEVQSRVWE